MQRYILIINNSGLDAVMPISNSQDSGKIGDKAKIILTFEEGTDPRNLRSDELNKKIGEILSKHPELKGGGADPREYMMFNLRAQVAGGEPKTYYIGLDKSDMKKIRGMEPERGAFHILDILITGKTDLGKFDDDSGMIFGVNLNKDWEEKKSRAKKTRRVFYNSLIKVEDDPDEI